MASSVFGLPKLTLGNPKLRLGCPMDDHPKKLSSNTVAFSLEISASGLSFLTKIGPSLDCYSCFNEISCIQMIEWSLFSC